MYLRRKVDCSSYAQLMSFCYKVTVEFNKEVCKYCIRSNVGIPFIKLMMENCRGSAQTTAF